jgi:hypothetical protein
MVYFTISLSHNLIHSCQQVSLTYLRGLEVKHLDAEDMPILEL